jgi:hypothetical protein
LDFSRQLRRVDSGNPGRSTFVTGVTADGRIVYFENGEYICDDGSILQLPIA